MSNRMSVLSRRLERFAVVFSVATFCFFFIGLFASANAKGQLVFLCAGLFSACLFATFFLWLAHGFAWAMIPEKPAAKEPAETLKSTEEMRPAEQMRLAKQMRPAEEKTPAEAMKPAEVLRPAETMKPAEAIRPAEVKPAEAIKPAEAMKPAEALKPAEAMKPAEEKVIAPEDPPDAKYTITGKRIY
jgi:hypothetical protein